MEDLVARDKPVVNQPRYNVFDRHIEKNVLGTCEDEGLGVIWNRRCVNVRDAAHWPEPYFRYRLTA